MEDSKRHNYTGITYWGGQHRAMTSANGLQAAGALKEGGIEGGALTTRYGNGPQCIAV